MAKAKLIARVLLGLIFFVFGLNGFFHFIAVPPSPEKAQAFLGALFESGYFFPFLKITEVVCGALLLAGFYVPLSLIVLAPITLNIFLFHLFLAPSGMPLAIVSVALNAFLGWSYKASFKSVLKMK